MSLAGVRLKQNRSSGLMFRSTCETGCNYAARLHFPSFWPHTEALQDVYSSFKNYKWVDCKIIVSASFLFHYWKNKKNVVTVIELVYSCKDLQTKFSLTPMLSLKLARVHLSNGAGGKHLHVLQGSMTSNAQQPQAETQARLHVSVPRLMISLFFFHN